MTTTNNGEKEIIISLDEEQPVCETKEEEINTQRDTQDNESIETQQNRFIVFFPLSNRIVSLMLLYLQVCLWLFHCLI